MDTMKSMKKATLNAMKLFGKKYLILCGLIIFLTACGGGGSESGSSTTANPFVSYTYTATNTSILLNQLSIDWSYDLTSNPDVAGFKVYDAQGTMICSGEDLQALQTQDPQILHIDCNYNDANQNPTFTMTAYDINNNESAHSAPFTANKAPVAAIYAGWDNTTVHFDAGSSYDFDGGSIVAYTWDFGDGSSSNNVSDEHVFTTGDHIITLEVVDNSGITTSTEISLTVS